MGQCDTEQGKCTRCGKGPSLECAQTLILKNGSSKGLSDFD